MAHSMADLDTQVIGLLKLARRSLGYNGDNSPAGSSALPPIEMGGPPRDSKLRQPDKKKKEKKKTEASTITMEETRRTDRVVADHDQDSEEHLQNGTSHVLESMHHTTNEKTDQDELKQDRIASEELEPVVDSKDQVRWASADPETMSRWADAIVRWLSTMDEDRRSVMLSMSPARTYLELQDLGGVIDEDDVERLNAVVYELTSGKEDMKSQKTQFWIYLTADSKTHSTL